MTVSITFTFWEHRTVAGIHYVRYCKDRGAVITIKVAS